MSSPLRAAYLYFQPCLIPPLLLVLDFPFPTSVLLFLSVSFKYLLCVEGSFMAHTSGCRSEWKVADMSTLLNWLVLAPAETTTEMTGDFLCSSLPYCLDLHFHTELRVHLSVITLGRLTSEIPGSACLWPQVLGFQALAGLSVGVGTSQLGPYTYRDTFLLAEPVPQFIFLFFALPLLIQIPASSSCLPWRQLLH